MMVLVDSSVIVDYFNGLITKQTTFFEHLLEKESLICTCGPVLTEVLQGIKNEKVYKKCLDALNEFIYVGASKSTHINAAILYRNLRKAGITPRGTIDCIIAATCIEHGISLLHNDKDFISIAKHTSLKLVM